jgi:hypothetical protein
MAFFPLLPFQHHRRWRIVVKRRDPYSPASASYAV